MYCSANHQFAYRISDDVIVEEIMTRIYADVCVMTADGQSQVINNYYYYLFGVFFFSLEITTHICCRHRVYSAMLYAFISLHSVPVFLSAITVDLFCHQTIDWSNDHVTADYSRWFFILYCNDMSDSFWACPHLWHVCKVCCTQLKDTSYLW